MLLIDKLTLHCNSSSAARSCGVLVHPSHLFAHLISFPSQVLPFYNAIQTLPRITWLFIAKYHFFFLLLHQVLLTFFLLSLFSGYFENSRHHPSLPERSKPARPDVTLAAVLWHPVGPGPAQQVWILGALQACPPARTEAASGEVAEGRQGTGDLHQLPGEILPQRPVCLYSLPIILRNGGKLLYLGGALQEAGKSTRHRCTSACLTAALFTLIIYSSLFYLSAWVLRGAGWSGESSGSNSGTECLSKSQRSQQSHPVFCRDWPIPQNCPVC